MEREDIRMLVKKWWDIYDDESLDYKNFASNFIAHPLIFKALSEAGVVDQNDAPSAA